MCGPWKAASDIILEPAIGEFGYDDFVRAPELICAGADAARAAVEQIRAWLPVTQPAAQPTLGGATVTNPAPALAK